jgi:serine/threonine protein kinase
LKELLRGLRNNRLTIKSTVQVGLQLIDRLESVHQCGYVHLDIKPDNILLASSNYKHIGSSEICLIDFGIAQTWRNEDGSHVPQQKIKRFCGNILFSSHNAFKGYSMSRRDDLISLSYLLCFLAEGDFLWLGDLRQSDPDYFDKVYQLKCKLAPRDICQKRAAPLLAFCQLVYRIKFEETPPYQHLKHLLRKILLDKQQVPN